MRSALDSEHGLIDPEDHGLQNISAMSEHGRVMAEAVDKAAALVTRQDPDGRRPLDDESVKYRLGRSIARMEAAVSTPGMYGRVALAQTMRDVSSDLMDILGAASALPTDTKDSADDGAAEYLYRHALSTGIYGGTMEVFRNMIAQHALKLGRPAYPG
jgi:3-oxocholest-4-en-26-oyl-CoA dehydrogenase alpha subunit